MTTQTTKPTFLRSAAGRVATMLLTGATLAGAGFVVVKGADVLMARAAVSEIDTTASPTPVSVTPLRLAPGYSVERRFLGQVEAAQSADLSFELGGKVVEILVDEGHSVQKGQALARLDTVLIEAEQRRLEASRAALSAELEFAEASVTRREALKERGFSPTEQFDQARATRDALIARIAETDAAIEATRLRLEKSVLVAPFDGRVGIRRLDTGVTVGAGQSVIQLLEDGAPIIRVGLPVWADPALIDRPMIEIAGQRHSARILSSRPDIDPATRTRTVLLALDGEARATIGQTATLTLSRDVAMTGAWVPVKALREGAQGVWTVFTVDDDSRVRPAAVELLHSEAERAFVRGSFTEGAPLIQSGPHRVTPGQLVQIRSEG